MQVLNLMLPPGILIIFEPLLSSTNSNVEIRIYEIYQQILQYVSKNKRIQDVRPIVRPTNRFPKILKR